MSFILKTIRIILRIIGGFFMLMGVSFLLFTPSQIKKDKAYYSEFAPSRNFVEQFHIDHGRYPTNEEFDTWASQDEINSRYGIITESIPAGVKEELQSTITSLDTYILRRWRGEWTVYYIAQTDEFSPKPWSYFAALKKLLWYGVPGFLLILVARKLKKIALPNKTLHPTSDRDFAS